MRKMLLLLILLAFPVPSYAANVILSWSPPTTYVDGSSIAPGEIVRYTILYGPQSGMYTNSLVVLPPATSVNIGGFRRNATMFFVITATTNNGLTSNYSNQVSKRAR
jgi:hypothetical protein